MTLVDVIDRQGHSGLLLKRKILVGGKDLGVIRSCSCYRFGCNQEKHVD